MMHPTTETICAIATPPGMGAVGIVRLSGPKAFEIAGKIFRAEPSLQRERAMRYGIFADPKTDELIDEGLVLAMPSPHSYTAEDVVEFHAHGNPGLLGRLLDAMMDQGALPAGPGEFTYRAVMNGRLDLPQAEAVQSLIAAQGDAARRESLRQLTGGLAAHLEPLENALQELHKQVEARIEFPEDGIAPLDRTRFEGDLARAGEDLVELAASYRKGKVLTEGMKIAIVGPPNAGKSSLLNALVGRDRAIVSPQPGTTRDVVEGEILVAGVRVRLFDTAGLREASHEVEEEGVRRSRAVIREADHVFWVLDAVDPVGGIQEAQGAGLDPDRTWYLFNKVDLLMDPDSWKKEMGLLADGRCLPISCKEGLGLPELWEVLESVVGGAVVGGEVVLLSARHRREIEEAVKALVRLGEIMETGETMDLWAEEIKRATQAIGRIRGRDLPAAAFDSIFADFCIGK
jgi:tRNA modification GTPase